MTPKQEAVAAAWVACARGYLDINKCLVAEGEALRAAMHILEELQQ